MESTSTPNLLDGYVPQKTVATQLNKSITTLWRLRNKLPYYRIAGRIYYRLDDVSRYVASSRVERAK